MDITRLIKAIHQAQSILEEAKEDQWHAPPNPVQNVGGRSSSIPDPTFNIANDERRLRLRQEVLQTEQSLTVLAGVLEARAEALENAVEAWQGKI